MCALAGGWGGGGWGGSCDEGFVVVAFRVCAEI